MKKETSPFTGLKLAGFCMQVSILLKSAVPLYEGLQVMAEDSDREEEKAILSDMADKVRIGFPFGQAVAESSAFPAYVLHMIQLGERTGTLDITLERLSSYYEKEYYMAENIRKAITYPAMMILMLLIILFVLFTRVMPVFLDVYEQMGTTIPPAAAAAIHFGGILSGFALLVAGLLLLFVFISWIFGKNGRQSAFTRSLMEKIKSRSKIARASADRRLCSVMAMTFGCGLDTSDGLAMAETLVDNKQVEDGIRICKEALSSGSSFFDSVKDAGLFSGFELQLVRVGSRAGQLEIVMGELEKEYDRKASEAIESMIARLEPTIVSILAAAVGLVLLSVMLPLAGILSTIG